MIENIYIEPNQSNFKQICERPKKDPKGLSDVISDIFQNVKENGDQALIEFTERFDRIKLDVLEVSEIEIQEAIDQVDQELKNAISVAKKNIFTFHEAQVTAPLKVETMQGVQCMQKSVGIEKVGIYIPGGTAPLFSTVLMLAIPATIAGCKEIILCTPPNENGKVHPAILFTAHLCGIEKIYKVGGAQAIAAMTLGTETIASVYKVFGPGNQYVTAAKQYAQNFGVALDSPAGPSELLVYADETSKANYIAADLLSQAEHGTDSQVLLVANNAKIIDAVNEELIAQIAVLPRKEIALGALENSKSIVLQDECKAFEFINLYGPEHLIIASEEYSKYTDKIINAGSVFLGNYCPESAGDYASGTNHTLPTDGWAKSYSGVNVDSFCRKITFQEITKKGIKNIGDSIIKMAEGEALMAHANAVKIRLEKYKNVES
ncbi:MAG: histidinol dehydrogenase [Saprospiraceae bacterium]|nr:histidinol dehydrogenase [Saprospiraceae bacterium]